MRLKRHKGIKKELSHKKKGSSQNGWEGKKKMGSSTYFTIFEIQKMVK